MAKRTRQLGLTLVEVTLVLALLVVIAAVSLVCGVLMLAASITSEKRRNTAWALWLLFFNVLPYALVLVAGRATGL